VSTTAVALAQVTPIAHGEARPARGARGVLVQVGLIAVATLAYLAVRAVTAGDPGAAEGNALDVLELEARLGLDWERGAQDLVLDHESIVRWFNQVYVWAFWPFVGGALVLLYRRDRQRYGVLRNALFASGAVGLAVFALFPVAPPRFLAGFTDTIATLSGQDGVAHPSGFTNEYAAMPSFHVGWTVLAGVCLLGVLRNPLARGLAIAHGGLMAVTVVVTANHYVLDAIAGVAVSLAALAIVAAAHRRQAPPPLSLSLGELATDEADEPDDAPAWAQRAAS
jgi:hypothetical protein